MDTISHNTYLQSILYVEDDLNTLRIITKALTIEFPTMQIYAADKGETALELFKLHKHNIVITDISLPGIDGLKLVTNIKLLDAMTQFIIISGHSEEIYQTILCELGIRYYIQKPINLQHLCTAIYDSIKMQETLTDSEYSSITS